MAKNKVYSFVNGTAVVFNKEIIKAVEDSPHMIQVDAYVSAASKARAIEVLAKVGIRAQESGLRVENAPYIDTFRSEGLFSGESVIVMRCTGGKGSPVVALIPTEDPKTPEIRKATTFNG